jgi:hexokinase
MDAIVRKTDAFLHKWNVTPDAVDMQACCNLFLSEMEQGLHGKKSSLAMIPTYTSTDPAEQVCYRPRRWWYEFSYLSGSV